jgi:ribosome maturation factor RimP
MNTIERIREIARKVVESEGMELYDVELHTGGNHCLVRIYIDKPGGIGVDDCAIVSEQVGLIMDVEDVIPHRYLLEVSSPGLTRALTKEKHFQKSIGKLISVKTKDLINGKRKFVGKLIAVSPDFIKVQDRDNEQEITIPLVNITKAHLEFDERELKKI